MPCDSSHLRAHEGERVFSVVACVIDELNGVSEIQDAWRRGYHPRVYSEFLTPGEQDAMTHEACERLQVYSDDGIRGLSLETQIWWRDHQIADRARVESEIRAVEEGAAREAALAKLTDYERELLGIKREGE